MLIPVYQICMKIVFNVISVNRKVALVIILTRAGLDLDSTALKRMRFTVPKLGLVPWAVECIVVAIMTRYLLDLPWNWAFLLGYDYIFKIEYHFFFDVLARRVRVS
jgi:hypothetical protein